MRLLPGRRVEIVVRIAQVSPLYESVPPATYGGTERVVSYLTEELVRLGHDVTLFASGDSRTTARLVAAVDRSLRTNPGNIDSLAQHFVMLEQIARHAGDFDILHFHIDYVHYPLSRRQGWTHLTTLHGRLDIPDLLPLYREFSDMPLVSISMAQRQPQPLARWVGCVHHGLPPGLYQLHSAADDYLAFVGRISPEKRVDRAVEIARRVGLPLRIAAKIDAADQKYFETEIAPLFELPFVEYLGELGEHEKEDLLGRARALLFPIDWAEPFGLVMIEAMACGTPVVAWRGGSVEEVIDDGITGYVVGSMDEAVSATERIADIDRRACRKRFESRFSASRMATNYLAVYERMLPNPNRMRSPRARGQVA